MKKYFKTIAIFIFILFIALQSNTVNAESGLTLTRKTYITYNGRTEAKFYTSKGYGYCITPERTGAYQGHNFTYSYTESDGGLAYILENATDTSDTGYLITQLAVWKYRSNFMPAAFQNTAVGNKAVSIANNARGKTTGGSEVSVKINTTDNNAKLINGYYTIGNMSIKFAGVNKYKVTVSGNQYAQLVDANGNVVSNGSEFATNQKFNVRVPADKVTEKSSFKVTLSVGKTVYLIKRYSPNNNALQDLVVPEKESKSDSDSATFIMTPVKRVCEYYNGKYYGKDGKETTELKYRQECETNICKKVGDKYFGKDGKETTELKYKEECETNICKKVGDKYFGKDGKETTELKYKQECETNICIIIGDKYFGKDGKETTELKYRQECETNICKIVGDKYFGKDGKETTESEYKAQCETPIPDTGVSPLSTILSIVLGSGIIAGTALLLKKYSKNN